MSLFKKKIKSPCQLICTIDADSICVGCYRSTDEIAKWDSFTEEQKQKVMENITQRRIEKGGADYSFG